jgi:hypothetical protein
MLRLLTSVTLLLGLSHTSALAIVHTQTLLLDNVGDGGVTIALIGADAESTSLSLIVVGVLFVLLSRITRSRSK